MLQKNKTKNGFSLIETLIAVFVFALVMMVLAGVFANLLKNYAKAKKTQRDVENAEYAMNLMAKVIRTSEIGTDLSNSMSNLDLFDYSQGLCIRYSYVSGDKRINIQTKSPAAVPSPTFSDCNFLVGLSAPSVLADGIVGAKIEAEKSSSSARGKVTISLEVQDKSQQTSVIPIQMSVSLRQ